MTIPTTEGRRPPRPGKGSKLDRERTGHPPGEGLNVDRERRGQSAEKGFNVEREGRSQSSERELKRKRGLFNKDLPNMMYGYGDDANPMPETVLLVEDIMVDYITDIMHMAQDVASITGSKLTMEDILFVIRKDTQKFDRAKELLEKDKELKMARKAFDTDEQTLFGSDA